MKILLINTVPTEKNGITNVILNYLQGMNTDDIILDYLSLNIPDEMYVRVVESKGGKLYVLPRLKGTLFYWNELRKLIKNNRYDAVHIHGNSHTLVLELSASWAAGCKVRIVHSHNTTCKHIMIHKLMTIPFNMLYTHGLACGEDAGKWMFGNNPFSVVNNGVDTKKYVFNLDVRDSIRSTNGWKECNVIGHVGSMIEAKNHSFILDIFRDLYNHNHSYRLLLIGDGNLRSTLEKKVSEYGLNDVVTMTGNIDNVSDYLNAMDLVLMPSLFEGLPLTLIEQQANGLRCVVADTITKEADKTGNLSFISLNKPSSSWVDCILATQKDSDGERQCRSSKSVSQIIDCGYSIVGETQKLKDYYLKTL